MNIRSLKRCLGFVIDSILILDGFFSKSEINKYHFNENLSGDKDISCIYATYLESNKFSKNEIELLKYLNDKTNLVVVVNNIEIEVAQIQEMNYILRSNIGRDFGAYNCGLNHLYSRSKIGSGVLMLNSSCIWETPKLDFFIEQLEDTEFVTSMTDSYRGGFHLQSFFLYVPQKYVGFLRLFFLKKYKGWKFKRSVVHYGERGISKYFFKENIPMKAFFPISNIAGINYKSLTSYVDLSRQLAELGAPFTKKSNLSREL